MTHPAHTSPQGPRGSEAGFAIVSVMLMGVVLMAIAAITLSQVDHAVRQSTGHVSFERQIHLAETGLEQALARLQNDGEWFTTATTPDTSSPAT